MGQQVSPSTDNKNIVLSKIVAISELQKFLNAKTPEWPVIVLCQGVFDLLHMGHVRHFQ